MYFVLAEIKELFLAQRIKFCYTFFYERDGVYFIWRQNIGLHNRYRISKNRQPYKNCIISGRRVSVERIGKRAGKAIYPGPWLHGPRRLSRKDLPPQI